MLYLGILRAYRGLGVEPAVTLIPIKADKYSLHRRLWIDVLYARAHANAQLLPLACGRRHICQARLQLAAGNIRIRCRLAHAYESEPAICTFPCAYSSRLSVTDGASLAIVAGTMALHRQSLHAVQRPLER